MADAHRRIESKGCEEDLQDRGLGWGWGGEAEAIRGVDWPKAMGGCDRVVGEKGRVIERLQMKMAELLKSYEEMVGQYGSEGEEAPPPHY